MTTYLTRQAWGARDPRGSTALVARQVEGIALHWPGTPKPIGKDRVAAALRGWQDDHMDNPKKRWSDIAYQAAVDQWGRAWKLRGLTTKSAANGDQDVNERFGAVLLILADDEVPTPAMIETVRDVIADFRLIFPAGKRIVPHSAIRPEPTDCPGDRVRALITSGRFNPTAPTPEESDDMTTEQADAMLAELRKITGILTGMNDRVGYIANEGMQDVDEIRDVMKPGQDG
jgi:hypothetical protein